MNILSVDKLSKSSREGALFTEISFGINNGEKIALIGRNGCGKSTLLSILNGDIKPDSGRISVQKGAGIAFLPQNPQYQPENSIREHLFSSNSPKVQLIHSYHQICASLAEEGGKSRKNQIRLEEISAEMDAVRGWEYEREIESVLTQLGILDLSIQLKTLSGGMLKKVELAQVLIEESSLLILDEPTNHLDIQTISWLEEYLQKTAKAVLMVTHDRYFLDHVCSILYEIDNAEWKSYKGNFSYYLEKRSEMKSVAARQEERIESILQKEMEWLKRGPKARGTKAKARKDSILKMMQRDRPEEEKRFQFEVADQRLGGVILEAKNVSKSYGGKKLLESFSHVFQKGERLGIFGDNGTGKTTFLDLLTQTVLPDQGRIEKGINTHFAYYQQNPQLLYSDEKVIDYIKKAGEWIRLPDGTQLSAVKFLERFGFTSKDLYSPLKSLSGGEKRRVYLVKLLIVNPNFLLLDEPTNDLDVQTMAVLEDFLDSYGGCLVVVSHDRCFMDRTVDHLLIFHGEGKVTEFPGTCSEYLEHQKKWKKEEGKRTERTKGKKDSEAIKKEKCKRTYKENREWETIEIEIEQLETEKKNWEEFFSSGVSDSLKIKEANLRYEELLKTLNEKYERWEHLASFDM